MQCRLNQEKYLRKYSVKKHKEKPDRVYLAYKKVDNNRIEKEKRRVCEIKSVNRHSMISDGAVSS